MTRVFSLSVAPHLHRLDLISHWIPRHLVMRIAILDADKATSRIITERELKPGNAEFRPCPYFDTLNC